MAQPLIAPLRLSWDCVTWLALALACAPGAASCDEPGLFGLLPPKVSPKSNPEVAPAQPDVPPSEAAKQTDTLLDGLVSGADETPTAAGGSTVFPPTLPSLTDAASPALPVSADDKGPILNLRIPPPSPTPPATTDLTGPPPATPSPSGPNPFSLDSPTGKGWWASDVSRPMRQTARPLPVALGQLFASTLEHSLRVKVLSDSPIVRETAIIESDAEFDWAAFVDTKWTDIDEPVGSALTTGGPPRFRNGIFSYNTGMRKHNRAGGRFEIGQAYGTESSNSVFFLPNPQGTARLSMNYTQPLLRGGGRVYNTGLTVLAQIDLAIARDDFATELQNHLTEVTRSYWALYLERGALLQRQKLCARGEEILKELEYRQEIDAVPNQIVRATAAVAARKADLYRSAAAVKNAEARIRALVNDPCLGVLDEIELTPVDGPQHEPLALEMHQAIEAGVRHRPEIQVALKQIKASGVRLDIAKNELLPMLDAVLETYVAGLRGDRDVGGAFVNQFDTGAPSYSTGLKFEVPLNNRAARARFQQRAIELRQFQNQLKTALAALQLEVEIAVREVLTTHREIEAKWQAMQAAATEVEFIVGRWKLLAGDDRSATIVLEDLLAAQERLTNQEFEFLTAEVQYNLAIVELQKALGTLLQVENVTTYRTQEQGIPQLGLTQGGVPTDDSNVAVDTLQSPPQDPPPSVTTEPTGPLAPPEFVHP